MVSLNKVQVIGRLGRDPDMRFTPNGNPLTTFSVATDHKYTTDGEQKQETEWFSVICWNKLAEVVNQHCTKGQLVFVEGRLQTRSWEGQDGEKKYRTQVVASQVLFLSRAGEGEVPEGGPDEVPDEHDLP